MSVEEPPKVARIISSSSVSQFDAFDQVSVFLQTSLNSPMNLSFPYDDIFLVAESLASSEAHDEVIHDLRSRAESDGLLTDLGSRSVVVGSPSTPSHYRESLSLPSSSIKQEQDDSNVIQSATTSEVEVKLTPPASDDDDDDIHGGGSHADSVIHKKKTKKAAKKATKAKKHSKKKR
jgi:hypothetical protein